MSEQFSILFERASGGWLPQPGLDLRVEKLSWCAEGGPLQADLTAEIADRPPRGGFPAGLSTLAGCGVRIFNAAAEPVWWGYLARIEAQYGALAWNLDMRRMTNRVAVQYWQRQAHLEWQGEKTFSPWAEDARSIRLYGVKERVLFLNSLVEEQAEAARDAWLAASSLPTGRTTTLPVSSPGRPEQIRLRLVCRGWWETIGWRYAHLFDGYEGYIRPAYTSQTLGRYNTSDSLLAQSFQTSYGPWQCGEVLVRLYQTGGCSDGVTVTLCPDASGNPNTAAPLSSQSVSASLIRGLHWVRFILPSPPVIQPNTPYWVVLQRSGALSASQFYHLMRDDNNAYPGGLLRFWNGSSWAAQSGGTADINFYLVGYKLRSERILELSNTNLGGQFLSTARLQATVPGYTLLWRDGTLTCLEELRELLQAGDSSGRRLLAEICADRSLLIRSEPGEEQAEYAITADGAIRALSGAEVSLAWPSAGRRALLAPGWLDQSVLIWKAEWTPQNGLRAVLEDKVPRMS